MDKVEKRCVRLAICLRANNSGNETRNRIPLT